jgi:hypothetical protein
MAAMAEPTEQLESIRRGFKRIAKACEEGDSEWVSGVPKWLRKAACKGQDSLVKRGSDKPIHVPSETVDKKPCVNVKDGVRYPLHGPALQWATAMRPLTAGRRNGSTICTGIKGGNFYFNVGQIVEVLSEKKVSWNYLLYITEVNIFGYDEGMVSGFWVYKPMDVRATAGCEQFRGKKNEVFLTHVFARVGLTSVLEVVNVRPHFMRTGEEQYWYASLFEHDKLRLRELNFGLDNSPEKALEILSLDWEASAGAVEEVVREFVRKALGKLSGHCKQREIPTGRGGLRLKMDLPLRTVLALSQRSSPRKVLYKEGKKRKRVGNGKYEVERNPSFILSWETVEDLTPLLGPRWNQYVIGTGIQYTYMTPVSVESKVKDDSAGILRLYGLQLANEVGHEQWNDRRKLTK